jgi:pyrroline-5-carboxylate reductase
MKIGIIGCGNMGEVILSGMLASNIASAKEICVSDKDSAKLDQLKNEYGIEATFNNSNVAKESDVIIVAVKPQEIDEALTEISGRIEAGKMLISIVAGVTTKRIKALVGEETLVVRVMPNMPALIKSGFSAIAYSKGVNKELADLVIKIFGSIGDVVEVDEKDLDAITAVSGSGPAYFFYLVEQLVKNGVKLGLEQDVAEKAALKTALGSAELLISAKEDAEALRKKVTSKGGTTEAAFHVFKEEGLEEIIRDGIKAARDRSKELSGE